MPPEITESWTSNGITVQAIEAAQRLEFATRAEIKKTAESIKMGTDPEAAVAVEVEVTVRESP